MRIVSGFLVCLLLAACSSSAPSGGELRQQFEQELPSLLSLTEFNLENRRNVGDDEQPVWMARFTAKVAPREATYDIDTVEGGVRILKQVRAAGEALSMYGTVRSTRQGKNWQHRFQADGSSKPVIGRPRSDYGADALVADSPQARALLAKIEKEKELARIAEETRLAAEAAERRKKEEAEVAKRTRIEAAVAKYGAAFAPKELGDMVDAGSKRAFLVTASAGGDRARVWGTDDYTCGSNFARAVVHAGLLKEGEAGIVEVAESSEGRRGGFVGSPRNGVSSRNATAYNNVCTLRLLERIPNG